MKRTEMIDILTNTVSMIHQHHACNLCDSHGIYEQSHKIQEVITQLRMEEAASEDETVAESEVCWMEQQNPKYCGVALGYSNHKNCTWYSGGICTLLDK